VNGAVEAVIVDAVRTPIGRAVKGSLRAVRADDLAAIPLRALIARNPGVDFDRTDDVMMGAASSSGEQGYNVGRNALLLAGIDARVPGCTVNRFCASSLQTIRMAFHAIKAGEGDQYIAAGVEATSRGAGMTLPVANPKLDGTNGTGFNVYIPMGLTAENVAEAVRQVRPFGVDVASGVELSPGVKDAPKLRAFFTSVREADRNHLP